MKPGFLFDNDGVLMDSSEFHWESWQILMKEENVTIMDYQQFVHGFGKRNDLILHESAPQYAAHHSRWAQRKEELFRECARGRITLLPGMEAFLQKVQEAEISRIIASSTPPENLQMFLESTILGKYFSEFVSGEQVARGKPFPDVFLAAAQKINKPPQECIVFEDAPSGIQAAKAAGCFVVALGTSHDQKDLKNYDLFYPSATHLNLEEILISFEKWKANY